MNLYKKTTRQEDKNYLSKIHLFQWDIILRLKENPEARFNELKPKDMDPKQFTYHLSKLREFELVDYDQKKSKYLLNDKSKLLISFFTKPPSAYEWPSENYILLYIKKNNKVLTVVRKIAPYKGHLGVICCYINNKDSVVDSAEKYFKYLGFDGEISFNLLLEVLYRNEKGEVKNHVFMHVFYGLEPKGVPIVESDEGKLLWTFPNELLKAERGYDNSKDLVDLFENPNFDRKRLYFVSKVYSTPW